MARTLDNVEILLRVTKAGGVYSYVLRAANANATDPGATKVWDQAQRNFSVAYTLNSKTPIEDALQAIYDAAETELMK